MNSAPPGSVLGLYFVRARPPVALTTHAAELFSMLCPQPWQTVFLLRGRWRQFMTIPAPSGFALPRVFAHTLIHAPAWIAFKGY